MSRPLPLSRESIQMYLDTYIRRARAAGMTQTVVVLQTVRRALLGERLKEGTGDDGGMAV